MMIASPIMLGDVSRDVSMIFSIMVGPLAYFIGMIIIIPLALYYWKVLWRWYPAQVKTKKAAVEQG